MAEQRRVALIFAVDDYDHPDLQRLSAPVADANALAETLGREELGGFDVEVCHNSTSAATAEKLEDFLIERRPGDLALLHFSCHGLKDDSGGLYLAARNTVPTRLASTAIDTTLINLLMRRSRARSIVLFLDCCYGGAFERGMTARAGGDVAVRDQFSQEPLGGGRGRVVITASSAVQYAFEGTRLADPQGVVAPSLFTGAVVAGIRTGEADRDADGLISLGELYDYVYENVVEQTPHQTPSKWEYGLEGDLVIAKSPRRKVHPTDLPEPLLEVIRHPYPVVRRGAVEELARLANDTDLPIALTALNSLRAMSDDDSRSVAAAASAAVDAMTVTVSLPALSFGEHAVGPEPAELSCELIGPPLAQTADISSEPTTFAARLDGQTIRVRMDVAVPGEFTGSLCIRSVMGEVRIPVTGAVRAAPSPVPAEAAGPVSAAADVERLAPVAAADVAVQADAAKPAAGQADAANAAAGQADAANAAAGQADAANAAAGQPHPEKPPTRQRDPERPAAGGSVAVAFWVAPALAALGAVFIGFALSAPWASSAFGDKSLWNATATPGIIQLLPCLVVLCSAAGLISRRRQAAAVGGLFGGGWASLGLLTIVVVIQAGASSGSWYPGVAAQVAGVFLVLTAGLIAVRSAPGMRTAVTTRSDWRSFSGLIVVLAGLVFAVADLANHDGSAPWMWVFPVLLAILALPIPHLRLTGPQRTAALTMIVTFVVLWIDDTPWLVDTGIYPWVSASDWWTLCLPPIIVVVGCFVGQLPRPPVTANQSAGEQPEG